MAESEGRWGGRCLRRAILDLGQSYGTTQYEADQLDFLFLPKLSL